MKRTSQDHLMPISEGDSSFDILFDITLKNAFNENKLFQFTSQKRKDKKTIKEYFSETFKMTSTKLIFIDSVPFCGIDILINHIFINFENKKISQDFRKSIMLELCNELDYSGKEKLENMHEKFIIVKDFPIEMYLEYFSKGFLKEEKKLFEQMKDLILSFILNSNFYPKCLIFYWNDGTGDNFKYHTEKFFGKEIIQHQLTETLSIHKPNQRNMKTIFYEIKNRLNLEIYEDNVIESFDGNLLKMKNYFQNEYNKKEDATSCSHSQKLCSKKYFNMSTQKFSQEITRDHENTNEDKENNFNNVSFFHLIGKILYNKRLNKSGKAIAMTKSELNSKPAPKMYFNLKSLINTMQCNNKEFNETLAENSFDHFRDIKELAKACEAFSLGDTLSKSSSFNSTYTYDDDSLKNMQSKIYAMACMQLNKSQYGIDKLEKTTKIGKSTYNASKYSQTSRLSDKKILKDIYHSAISKNPFLSNLSYKRFVLEIHPILNILKMQKEGKGRGMNAGNGHYNLSLDAEESNQFDNKRVDEFFEFEANNINGNKFSKQIHSSTSYDQEYSEKILKTIFNNQEEKEIITLDNLDEHIDEILNYIDNVEDEGDYIYLTDDDYADN